MGRYQKTSNINFTPHRSKLDNFLDPPQNNGENPCATPDDKQTANLKKWFRRWKRPLNAFRHAKKQNCVVHHVDDRIWWSLRNGKIKKVSRIISLVSCWCQTREVHWIPSSVPKYDYFNTARLAFFGFRLLLVFLPIFCVVYFYFTSNQFGKCTSFDEENMAFWPQKKTDTHFFWKMYISNPDTVGLTAKIHRFIGMVSHPGPANFFAR